MSSKQVWKPVETGYSYFCACDDCIEDDSFWQHKVYVDQDELGIGYADESDEGKCVYLPGNLRLCQLTDAAPLVPGAWIETQNDTLLQHAAQAALGWIDDIYPPDLFDGSSGDFGEEQIVAIRETLRAALQRPPANA